MLHLLVGFFHILVCVALIFFILIQSNKGMGLSGAFGAAGASDSVFGATGGLNVLMKITIGLCAVFVITSCALSFVEPPQQSGSVVDQAMEQKTIQDLIEESRAGQEGAQLPEEQQPAQQP